MRSGDLAVLVFRIATTAMLPEWNWVCDPTNPCPTVLLLLPLGPTPWRRCRPPPSPPVTELETNQALPLLPLNQKCL